MPRSRNVPAVPTPQQLRAMRARRARQRRLAQRRKRLFMLAGGILMSALLLFLLTGLAHSGEDKPARDDNSLSLPAVLPADDMAKFVVAVDPGHGGFNQGPGAWDAGAEGVDIDEADMTWNTAQALLALLQADDRFEAFLTKDHDTYLKPSERAAVAKEHGAQLFLSIHGNSDPVYGSTGFECYPTPPGRTHYEESLRFAKLLAEGFSGAGAKLRGAGGVRFLYYGEGSKKQIIESYDTAVRDDPSFTVLEESGCPAVLAEQCFVTSRQDMDAFGDDDGCQTSAAIYYKAICAWFAVEPLDPV